MDSGLALGIRGTVRPPPPWSVPPLPPSSPCQEIDKESITITPSFVKRRGIPIFVNDPWSPIISQIVDLPSGGKEYVIHSPWQSSGDVRLMWFTPNPEKTILEIAKISNDYPNLDNTKLLETAYNGGHFSVFQMANICIEISTSREISRQIMRHWTIHMNEPLNVQELSQRYKWYGHAEPTNKPLLKTLKTVFPEWNINENLDHCTIYPFFYKDLRYQDKKNRQASVLPDLSDANKESEYARKNLDFYEDQIGAWINAVERYRFWQSEGCAKDKTRCFLPEAMTETRFCLNTTVRSWIHYLNGRALRKTGIPQTEHEEVAIKIMDIFKSLCPCIYELMMQGKLTHYDHRGVTELSLGQIAPSAPSQQEVVRNQNSDLGDVTKGLQDTIL